MQIDELVTLLASRLTWLNAQRSDAERVGDLAYLMQLDAKIADTTATLTSLRGLIE